MLSSTARRMAPPLLLLLSVAAAAATLTFQHTGSVAPEPRAAPPLASAPGLPPRTDPLWPAIDQWNRLRQSDRLPFGDYAAFLVAHPGWPGEAAMRRAAERQIAPGEEPERVAAFFARIPPTTGAGRVRLAEALAALGRTGEARDAAAAAWDGGALSADDEGRLTARFAGQFTPVEQDGRMERLLWDRATASAIRQLAFVSPGRRPIYAARLAYQTRAADAQVQAGAVGSSAERDGGYLVDRASWLRDTGQWTVARALLAQPRALDAAAFDPQKYLETLLAFAKAAAADGQAETAYGIAANGGGAFPLGTDVSQRPLPERDAYTSLVWLGAQAALKTLGRPRDAAAMFRRYAAAAQSPGSKARGLYWAARADDRAGDSPAANADYIQAATNVDQFYGQLAAERLGRAIALPPDPPAPGIGDETRARWMEREIVRAAQLLGEQHDWQDQGQFVKQIASEAKTAQDHVLAGELARGLARPDLGVIVARVPRPDGMRDPIRTGFPTTAVPPSAAADWTMVHAISRQESQFDRAALSPVGARGLMQLMTATAREQAGKLGLPYDAARLTSDTGYNATLGAAFWERMLRYYNGDYVLAVAAYNAGPGNVNRFIRDHGDPRLSGVDPVDWIEAIPFQETRAYVQKVLENAVIYDLLDPARGDEPERDRLAFYLGRKPGG